MLLTIYSRDELDCLLKAVKKGDVVTLQNAMVTLMARESIHM